MAGLLQDRDSASIGLGRSWLLGCAVLSMALHLPLAVDGHMTHWSFGLAAAACLFASLLFVGDCWKKRCDRAMGRLACRFAVAGTPGGGRDPHRGDITRRADGADRLRSRVPPSRSKPAFSTTRAI